MRTGPIAESPLPADATWDDYVTAHGGPEQTGWWVTLCWYADAEHPRPEAVGPYRSYEQAVCAMEDSLLIDSFAEDTKRAEWLDDVYVAAEPASITRMCDTYRNRVTLIDPGDPNHFGRGEVTATDSQSEAAGISVWYAGMQAAALATPAPKPPAAPVDGTSRTGHHSPGSPAT